MQAAGCPFTRSRALLGEERGSRSPSRLHRARPCVLLPKYLGHPSQLALAVLLRPAQPGGGGDKGREYMCVCVRTNEHMPSVGPPLVPKALSGQLGAVKGRHSTPSPNQGQTDPCPRKD